MNLYKLHSNPDKLIGHEKQNTIPKILWDRISVYNNIGFRNSKFGEKKALQQIKNVLIKDPLIASEFAIQYLDERWPEAEPVIMKDPGGAFEYAYAFKSKFKEGRWPEAEPYIMKDPEYANDYASEILYSRWPEAEPGIMKDPKYAFSYSRYVMSERWPEAEKYIKQDPMIWEKYKRNWNIDQ